MKEPQNIEALTACRPDFMGFIFYEKSPRYVGDLSPEVIASIAPEIRKIGVFVNEAIADVVQKARDYRLDCVQLHGDESPAECRQVKAAKLLCIKAFPIATAADFERVKPYDDAVDFFLFDTATCAYGGSGQQFDWDLLNAYTGKIPFLLSGGISCADSEAISRLSHPQLYGVDINSRFETKPGLKNIVLVDTFIQQLQK